MKNGNYQIGVIGYGGMGSWHCENITKRIERLSVAGIFDIQEEAKTRAKTAGFFVYDTVQTLLNDRNVDIILVTTPNNFHKEYSILAMEQGKNVVCEKPVCLDSVELEEILSVSKKTGKLFTVHQNRRFDIDYSIVKNIIDNQLLGKVYYLDSRLYGSKGLPGDWRSSMVAGGGMLYDWSVHLIDQVLTLVDSEPISVYCELDKIRFQEVDDCNRIVINFANGLRAHITVDTWCYIGEPRWHLSGDDGSATITHWLDKKGEIIKANIKEVDWEEGCIFSSNGRSRTMSPRPIENLEKIALPIPKEEPRWEGFYENVLDCLDKKATMFVTHEQIRKTTKVVDACFLSAKENKVVNLEIK